MRDDHPQVMAGDRGVGKLRDFFQRHSQPRVGMPGPGIQCLLTSVPLSSLASACFSYYATKDFICANGNSEMGLSPIARPGPSPSFSEPWGAKAIPFNLPSPINPHCFSSITQMSKQLWQEQKMGFALCPAVRQIMEQKDRIWDLFSFQCCQSDGTAGP